MANRNARVLMLCRNQEKGERARKRIIYETGNPEIILKIADLSSMRSVRAVAEEINREEANLHILINNAGLAGMSKMLKA